MVSNTIIAYTIRSGYDSLAILNNMKRTTFMLQHNSKLSKSHILYRSADILTCTFSTTVYTKYKEIIGFNACSENPILPTAEWLSWLLNLHSAGNCGVSTTVIDVASVHSCIMSKLSLEPQKFLSVAALKGHLSANTFVMVGCQIEKCFLYRRRQNSCEVVHYSESWCNATLKQYYVISTLVVFSPLDSALWSNRGI